MQQEAFKGEEIMQEFGHLLTSLRCVDAKKLKPNVSQKGILCEYKKKSRQKAKTVQRKQILALNMRWQNIFSLLGKGDSVIPSRV